MNKKLKQITNLLNEVLSDITNTHVYKNEEEIVMSIQAAGLAIGVAANLIETHLSNSTHKPCGCHKDSGCSCATGFDNSSE